MEASNLKGLYAKVKTDKKIRTLVVAGFCTLVALAIFITLFSRSVLEVSVSGQVIGNVKNQQVLEQIKIALEQEYKDKLGADVEFAQEVKGVSVKAIGQKVDTEDEMIEKLEAALSFRLKAVAIKIDGEEIAMVKDKATAEMAFNRVKEHYINETPGELIKVEVAEKVKLVERYVYPNEVIDQEDAVNLILKGAWRPETTK